MSETLSLSEAEINIGQVTNWLDNVSETGEVKDVNPEIVKGALEAYGANFEIGPEAKESLGKYSNKGKKRGIEAVWGKVRFGEYKEWAEKWADRYKEETGISLPALRSSGIKTSGMRHFLGELTAFAAGEMSFDDLRRYWEARLLNGKLWQEKRLGERRKIKVPTKQEPILLASIPPGFA